jgi:hypothetical protein
MATTKKTKSPFFAEVVESSLYGWKAQSWQWSFSPSFGSLVTLQTNARTWFGIVYQSATGSNDPSRHPYAYQKTDAELMAEQPQIFNFLQTTFECVTVGFSEHEKIVYQIAPEPPKIHTFVQYATVEQARAFFASYLYLSVLFQATHIPNLDELLLAIMWNQQKVGLLSEEKITASVEHLSLLTGNDYRRIKLLLQRLEANNLIH